MAKDAETGDLFEADGVTPKAKESAITPEVLEARVAAAKAEGKVEGLEKALKAAPKETKAAAPEKIWTRAELRAQVNDGKITEDQMDETLERQSKAEMLRLVDEKVTAKVAATQAGTKTSEKIDAYVAVFPDINKDGSALRAKVEAEFLDMLNNGSPDHISTELAAIKIVCGPLQTGAGRKPAPESHEETGGGGSDGGRPDNDGWAKGLSAGRKKHYQKLIDRGIYKGHSDPQLQAELKLARGKSN